MGAGRPLALAVLGALLLGSHAPGAESFDRRVREMLLRAEGGEEPTPEDRRTALRALRDWELSERTAPLGNRRIGFFLRATAAGQRAPPHLRPVASRLRRRYLTKEGRTRRLREGPYGPGGAPPLVRAGTGSPRQPDPVQYWFLFFTCLAIVVGGLVVWSLTRPYRRADHRTYYS